MGILLEAEVVLEDGGDQGGQLGVSGIGGVFKIVLAIAIGVIEQAAFGLVDEAVGFLQGVEVDDRDLLEHLAGAAHEAADVYRQEFIALLLPEVRGDESALIGERDALEVIGQGLPDDIGDGGIGTGLPANVVVLGYHGSCSLVGTALSMSLMISWVTSWRSHLTDSSVSSSFQSQYSSFWYAMDSVLPSA